MFQSRTYNNNKEITINKKIFIEWTRFLDKFIVLIASTQNYKVKVRKLFDVSLDTKITSFL